MDMLKSPLPRTFRGGKSPLPKTFRGGNS